MISMIAAKSKNSIIGNENKLIWSIPEDLAHFKEITLGKTVVMGRSTYESIGKPLPGRKNVVLSRNVDLAIPGVLVVNSKEEILKMNNVIIIGGEKVYSEFLKYASTLYITEIDKHYEGDTKFPEISQDDWELTSSVEGGKSTNETPYFFNVYTRK